MWAILFHVEHSPMYPSWRLTAEIRLVLRGWRFGIDPAPRADWLETAMRRAWILSAADDLIDRLTHKNC